MYVIILNHNVHVYFAYVVFLRPFTSAELTSHQINNINNNNFFILNRHGSQVHNFGGGEILFNAFSEDLVIVKAGVSHSVCEEHMVRLRGRCPSIFYLKKRSFFSMKNKNASIERASYFIKA